MRNFANRIAIRVSDKVFTKSMIEGLWIRTALERMGYYVGDLRFYPNKPYLCTFYKGDSGRLGTTNTPFKEGRTVIEEWNKDLFFALCCQRDGDSIQAGEFYTINKTGEIHRCSSLVGEWIRTDLPEGGNIASQKAHIHKSTIQELTDHFSVHAIINDEQPVKPTVKRGRQRFWEDAEQAEQSPDKTIVAATEILDAKRGLTVEQMTSVAEKHEVDLIDHPAANTEILNGVQTVEIQSEPAKTIIPGRDWTEDQAQEWMRNLIPDKKMNAVSEHHPMTFREILQWFGEGKDVCVGTVEDGHVECKVYQIESVTKEKVGVAGNPFWVPFDDVFRSTGDFLRYALQKVS